MTTESETKKEFSLGDVKVEHGEDGVPYVRVPAHTGMILYTVTPEGEPTFGFMMAGPKGFTLEKTDPEIGTHITRLALAYGLTRVAALQFQQIYELGLGLLSVRSQQEAEKAEAAEQQLLLDLKKPDRPAVDLSNMGVMGRG